MACFLLPFLLLSIAIPQKYFTYGFVTSGLIWSRNISSFVPIASISTFALEQQEWLRKSRDLEIHNFGREVIKLAYYEEKNLFGFKDNNTKITGVSGEIWNILSDYLNFTLHVTRANVSHYGLRMANGSYDGLVGMLLRNEVHIIPRTGYYVAESAVMDYTTPIWENNYRLYIKPEFTTDSTWMFNMFSRQVWCSILFLLVLISTFGYTAQKISIKVSNSAKVPHNFHDHLFYTFATFCCQGFIPETLYHRIKILSLTKKLFAWLLLIVLSSYLISYMTNQKVELPFTDLKTMFNRTTYNVVIFKGSIIYDKFKKTLARTVSQAESSGRVVLVDTIERMYQKACWGKKKKYAILESMDRQRAYGRLLCKLVPVETAYFPTWVASGVAKGFKYKRTIDVGMLKLNEFGLTDGMKDRWMDAATVKYDVSTVSSVNFHQVIMLLMILCMGIVASVAIFVVENAVFVYNYNRRRSLPGILLK